MDRGDCKLVVIDPIMAFVRGGASLRNTLMTLVMMAGDLHVAILAVTHLRAGRAAGDVPDRGRERVDFGGAGIVAGGGG